MKTELTPKDAGYKWFTCPTCDGSGKIGQDQQAYADQQVKADKSKYDDLYNSIQRHFQTLIARNYNNIGVWSNERQQYNFELISEVEELLKQHNKIKQP